MAERCVGPIADLEALSEADLLRLVRQNHARAFQVIVRRHNRRLYRVARAVMGDDREAEDVVQEAYLRAFIHVGEFRGDSSISTWLTRITVNVALDKQRGRATNVESATFDDGAYAGDGADVVAFPLGAATVDPERVLAQREIIRLLERAIDALPEPFRVVLVMRMVEEMSVEETAGILGLPDETVRTRLHRARRLLRQSINAEVGSAVTQVFPFAGLRCAGLTSEVSQRLGLAPPPVE
jgi:RNA polymerase sigma-70 factor, ECF subfamily